MDKNKIIFIGAMGIGKTSVAKELSKRLSMEYIDIDSLRWDFFKEQEDYDNNKVGDMFKSSNEIAAFDYLKPFEARFTIHILNKFLNGVFDFGAGYTVYKNDELFSRVKSAFEPYENIFLLRYSNNADESLEALRNRHDAIPEKLYYALNSEFINSPCNQILARHVVDTKGLSVNEIVDIVIPQLRII